MASSKTNRRWKRWLEGRAIGLIRLLCFRLIKMDFVVTPYFLTTRAKDRHVREGVCGDGRELKYWVRHIPWPRQTRCGRLDVVEARLVKRRVKS